MKRDEVNPTLYERIEAELLSGEDLLWVGQPHAGSVMNFWGGSPATLAMLTGVLVSLALGLAVFLGQSQVAPPGVLWAFFGFFALCCIIAGIGAPISNAIRAKNSMYAITNRRVLIMSGWRSQTVRSYGEQDIQFIERKMRGKTRGDLIFKREARHQAAYYGDGTYGKAYDVPIGFFGIENVRQVEAILFETFRGNGTRQWGLRDKPKRRAEEDVPEEITLDEFEERDTRRLQG